MLADCLLILLLKESLVFMPHQLSLFSVLVFSDFLAPFLDYAAHSVPASRF